MAAGHAPVTLGSSGSRCAAVDGFLVTWVRFPPLLKLPLHTHERATVAVILNGSSDGLMRHASHPCPASTALTEPPGELHGNVFERAGADVLTVQPDPGRLELLEPLAGLLGEVNHARDLGVASVARRAAGELRMPDGVTPLAVEGLVLELLAPAARLRKPSPLGPQRRPPHWLGEARALLHHRVRGARGGAQAAVMTAATRTRRTADKPHNRLISARPWTGARAMAGGGAIAAGILLAVLPSTGAAATVSPSPSPSRTSAAPSPSP